MGTTYKMQVGEMVFWNGSAVQGAVMDEVCERNGIRRRFRKITPEQALKMALKTVYSGSQQGVVMVRKSKQGWAVVREMIGDDGNTYQQETNWRLDSEGRPVAGESIESDVSEAVRREFRNNCGMVSSASVGHGMSAIIEGEFRGVKMRSRGGLMFIPEPQLEAWRRFADDLEQSTGGRVVAHRIVCDSSAETVKAIVSQSVGELRTRYTDLHKELASLEGSEDKRKKRRCERIRRELDELRQTAEMIGASVSKTSEVLDGMLGEIQSEQAMAALIR